MAFTPNPLALSVPEAAFEAWLRDTGYLEILDDRASTSAPTTATTPSAADGTAAAAATTATAATTSLAYSVASSLRTFFFILTFNPFAKLTATDFSAPTPSWTLGFLGSPGSYSWPAGPSQARLRVQENVRRYARNYSSLAIVFLACSLYKLPVSLLGLIVCLVLWELMRFCNHKWGMEQRYPRMRQVLFRLTQFAMAVVLYKCNIHMAFFCAISISYTVMIIHAFLRKLTSSKQLLESSYRSRSQPKKIQLPFKQS